MTIQLIPHGPDNIIGLDIDGWINAEDIDHITEFIETRVNNRNKLRIYAEVKNWSGMSLEAFIKDLKFSMQHLQDFEKEAIVSDRKWLKTLAKIGNKLFSSIEVKHFSFDEREQALEWIND